jgi:hypothetical protein
VCREKSFLVSAPLISAPADRRIHGELKNTQQRRRHCNVGLIAGLVKGDESLV